MKRCLYFVYVWPEPLSSAAGLRCHQIIHSLESLGYEIELASPSATNPIYGKFVSDGYHCYLVDPNQAQTFDKFSKNGYTLILFDRYILEEQFGWRARELWPQANFLIDTQDLHSLRKFREQQIPKTYTDSIEYEHNPYALPLFSSKDFLREMGALFRSDAALLLSKYEFDLLNSLNIFQQNQLFYFPLTTNIEKNVTPFNERSSICFFGNFRHSPNLDAFRWLIKKLWPQIYKKFPNLELNIFGAYPSREVSEAVGIPGVRFLGPIENHRSVLNKSLLTIAPLRYGAGIKGKVLESWACGTPVIGTPYAFEGTTDPNPLEVFLNLDECIKNIGVLQKNEDSWNKIQNICIQRVRRNFSHNQDVKHLKQIISALYDQPEIKKLAKKIIQNILASHEYSSTKYFSKWIELKNMHKPASLDP